MLSGGIGVLCDFRHMAAAGLAYALLSANTFLGCTFLCPRRGYSTLSPLENSMFLTLKQRHAYDTVAAALPFSLDATKVSVAPGISYVKSPVKAHDYAAGVMAAFGCNYEGDIAPDHVVGLVAQLMDIAEQNQYDISMIQLADTMGWANPEAIRRLVGKIQDRWPTRRINLHLHDTRGMGLMNAFAALEMGVDDFDSAVAGLGGCPYAGFKDAPGNIATEDLVHMCHELGIETGIDLEKLLDVAREAERIVGHPLPGKVMRGGHLDSYRRAAAAARSAQ